MLSWRWYLYLILRRVIEERLCKTRKSFLIHSISNPTVQTPFRLEDLSDQLLGSLTPLHPLLSYSVFYSHSSAPTRPLYLPGPHPHLSIQPRAAKNRLRKALWRLGIRWEFYRGLSWEFHASIRSRVSPSFGYFRNMGNVLGSTQSETQWIEGFLQMRVFRGMTMRSHILHAVNKLKIRRPRQRLSDIRRMNECFAGIQAEFVRTKARLVLYRMVCWHVVRTPPWRTSKLYEGRGEH